MTTEEMKALPIGTRVRSVRTGIVHQKIEDVSRDVYRCFFKRVTKNGLAMGFKTFHGKRIELLKEATNDHA